MNLLFLNHNVRGTGTWQRASSFARALAARGHRVTVVTTSPANRWRFLERPDDGGIRVLEAPDLWSGPARTGWDPFNTLRRVLRLWPEANRRQPARGQPAWDLIHAFDGRPVVSIPALALARRTRAALVMDWADWWGRGGRIRERSGWPVRTFFGPIETWFEEGFRRHAVAHTVISQALRERLLALAPGFGEEQVLAITNGCDPDVVRRRPRADARAALGLDADVPLAVHLGTLSRVEMGFLAGAVERLRGQLPAAQVVLLGRTGARVPERLLRSGALRATGWVSQEQLSLWLSAADVCLVVLPDTLGNRGRWPGKINDYFSAGRAVVIPATGDAAALVRSRSLGWVTEATPAAFAAGISAALTDPAMAEKAGSAARQLAEQELAWPLLAERLERFYYSALATRQSRE